MSALLDIKNIAVQFGGVQALQDVSFALNEGELLGLIGPNGAGKTTALRCISGIVTPDTGDVMLRGQSMLGMSINQRVRAGLGMSQQIVKPFFSMSVLENVALAAGSENTNSPLSALWRTGRSAAREKALDFLSEVGIADAKDAMPGELPLGYLKRLEMARALALGPSVLLLDEPLAGLNQQEARRLADTIKDLNGRGKSIILIEHNLGEVMRVCSRLVVLDNGRHLAAGLPDDVMRQADVRSAYLGEGA